MRTKCLLFLCLGGPLAMAQGQETVARAEAAPSAAAAAAPERNVRVIEQIIAKVNNEIVTLGELERTRKQLEASLQREKLPADKAEEIRKNAERDLLRDKIDELLLIQKAKDLSINVDSEVSKYMAQLQLDTKVQDPDKFQALVREQTGMSFEDFKAQARDQMMKQQVIRREVGSKITIPQTELRKYYDDHKDEFIREESVILREIFLNTEGKDPAAVAAIEKKAKDLVARGRKNENFGQMAHDNSEADTARNYGELPAFKRGTLKKEIEDVVFTQERGYVTDPIKTPNGLLILKVEEHYQSGLQPFEAVEQDVMEKMYAPRMQPALRAYLTNLRKDAFLEIRAGYVDTGAAPGKDTTWKDPAKLVPQTVTKEEVASQTRRKRLLWLIPIPGTKTTVQK